jgi:hypothetical protein
MHYSQKYQTSASTKPGTPLVIGLKFGRTTCAAEQASEKIDYHKALLHFDNSSSR